MDKNQQGIVQTFFYLLRKHQSRQICDIILKISDLDPDLILRVLRLSLEEINNTKVVTKYYFQLPLVIKY